MTGDGDSKYLNIEKVKQAPDAPKPRVKTAGRTRLLPSAALSRIIGSDLITYKSAAGKVIDYIETNGLYNGENQTITADKILREIFGKKTVELKEFKDLLLTNLEIAE